MSAVKLISSICAAGFAIATSAMAASANSLDALDLFETHQIVALGEHHGMTADDEWILGLLMDPRFIEGVDTVSIEFGAGTHQDTIDRYIRGETVSDEELQTMWSDGTHGPMGVSYSPFYETLAARIRAINLSERQDNPIGVILGDPGVDWEADPLAPAWMEGMRGRDAYWGRATLEATRNGDRILMIGGFGHFGRPDRAGMMAASEAQGYAAVVPLGPDGMMACGLDELWADEEYGAIVDVTERPEGQMDAGACFPGSMTFRNGQVAPAYEGVALVDLNALYVWLGNPENFPEGETFPPPTDPDLAARMQGRADQLGVQALPH